MIDYIRGELVELMPAMAVIEACGVGYALAISLQTYTQFQGQKQVKLYVYEVIREDAHLLYGFGTRRERECFELLISVSGIGGQTARMLLSAFSPAELAAFVRDENVAMIKSVKGIGPKAAQRIILDLKDKMPLDMAVDGCGATSASAEVVAPPEVVKEAVAALTMLGFAPAPTQKVVLKIVKDDATLPVEQIIKQALKML